MKILVAANDPTRFSAPNIWVLRVLPLLKEKGIEPEVAFFHYKGDSFPVLDKARSLGITCHLVPFNHTEQNICDLLKLAREIQPDVFVPNVNVAAHYACRYIRQAGIRTVSILRSDDAFYHDLIDEFIGGSGAWRVDAAVGVSEFLTEAVRQAGPEGFPVMACPSGTPMPDQRAEGPADKLVVTYSGRMVREQKRMDQVIPSMVEILKRNPHFEAVFQGDGPLRQAGLELIRKANLESRFKLPGFTDPSCIQEQLLKSNVFLMLSDYEGLSTALLEAMACGVVPIVKRMDSGISEIVTDGETGIVIDDRKEQLEEALKRLHNDPSLWRKLSDNARKLVESKYATPICAERWAKLLRRLQQPVDFSKLPSLTPEQVMLPAKRTAERGIAVEDHRLPSPAADLPVLLVRSHEFNYSETFIEDHVHYLSNKLDVLYGFPFPRFLKGKGSVLDPATETETRKHGTINSGPVWEAYVNGLARYLKSSEYKVVLAESGLMGSYVYKACELAGVPCVVHYHGADAFVENLLRHWKVHYDGSFMSASRLVVVSKAMRNQLLKLGAPPDRVVRSPYGVEVNVPQVADPENASPHYLSVGRFTEKKAPHLTLQAFARVLQEVPDAQLTMVGDGPLLDECRNWTVKKGISKSVVFAGVKSRDEVSQLMSQSRVFVQHSVRASSGDCEGLPLAILEAGAHGLPVVSTIHAGIPDAVCSGEHGFLVKEGDVDGMAKAMIQLGKDALLAGQMGAAYRQRVVDCFSRELSLKRLQEILLKAAVEKPPTPPAKPANGKTPVESLMEQIGMNRDHGPAYLNYGELLVKASEYEDAYLVLKEAQRIGALPKQTEPLLDQLETHPELDTELTRAYRSRIGAGGFGTTEKPRRILVFTNLLPPQEMGGYGRTVWEFCDGLLQRGHDVRILTADVPSLHKEPEPGYQRVEKHVKRNLTLFGNWTKGAAQAIKDPRKIQKIMQHNARAVAAEVKEFKPDVCMVGNLDFLGNMALNALLELQVPVLHRLGNALPGYPKEATPSSSRYGIAGCSEWVNEELQKGGYPARNYFVLHPGSPLKDYYRLIPPRFDQLRICYAGLIMAYKGPQVLVQALGLLRKIGIPFTCEIAGDTKDPAFLNQLQALIRSEGIADAVKLIGFCNRRQLAALYARSNVMVFPSVFEEPFGKSQIEAQAAGLAVVSSGTGGYADIITDGENGLVFKNQDAEDLARQLYILQGDPKLWEKLASKGQQDAFRFNTSSSVEHLESLLEEMILK
ncbi:MAG: glycosyltransferase [Puniceicoccaceae bacterium]